MRDGRLAMRGRASSLKGIARLGRACLYLSFDNVVVPLFVQRLPTLDCLQRRSLSGSLDSELRVRVGRFARNSGTCEGSVLWQYAYGISVNDSGVCVHV